MQEGIDVLLLTAEEQKNVKKKWKLPITKELFYWDGTKKILVSRMVVEEIFKSGSATVILFLNDGQQKTIHTDHLAEMQQPPITPKMFFDTKTTGSQKESEILEISFVNEYGDIVFNQRIRPRQAKDWEIAQPANNISPEDLKDKKTFDYYQARIQEIVSAAKTLISYNVSFNIQMLQREGINVRSNRCDVMSMYSESQNIPDKYFSLIECADYYRYIWESAVHGSLEDTLAIKYCYEKLVD